MEGVTRSSGIKQVQMEIEEESSLKEEEVGRYRQEEYIMDWSRMPMEEITA
jgi:hypothetical protein